MDRPCRDGTRRQPALAQEKPQSTTKQAEDIATQPAKDVGVVKTKIPPVLERAAEIPMVCPAWPMRADPGRLQRTRHGARPDFAADSDPRKSRWLKITGDTVAGLIVPFRGLVREVSGAASAQRELEAAIAAGFARRAFPARRLPDRGCKPAL